MGQSTEAQEGTARQKRAWSCEWLAPKMTYLTLLHQMDGLQVVTIGGR